MDRQQAINYLASSGFSMIQIESVAKAFGTLTEVDFQELKDRYGDEVEYVVRDMISGENLRWVELPRPKQEPTTKIDCNKTDCNNCVNHKYCDYEPTTKNDLGVDCISRAEAIKCLECDFDITGKENMKTVVNYINSAHDKIVTLPRVKQEPKTGHWIEVTNGRGGHECDVCHDYAPSFQSGNEYLSAFCPNCGAKMEEVEE